MGRKGAAGGSAGGGRSGSAASVSFTRVVPPFLRALVRNEHNADDGKRVSAPNEQLAPLKQQGLGVEAESCRRKQCKLAASGGAIEKRVARGKRRPIAKMNDRKKLSFTVDSDSESD